MINFMKKYAQIKTMSTYMALLKFNSFITFGLERVKADAEQKFFEFLPVMFALHLLPKMLF